ncbi:MAG: hypothetical protein CL769_01785 [Chloroflexi bacterium]|nr:hypothetical protein [Chloroflexota bacterium]|tara:strand:- start:4895 stop:5926 length:1032 start_codon:yes stop_codon:yes gene_type:complete
MSEYTVSNKDSKAFLTYQRILPSFKDLILKQKSSVSDYWAEEVDGFSYMLEAPPSIINSLRHHCYHITGELPYQYRSHHTYNSYKYKSKLELLNSLTTADLIVPEPKNLGGFGYEFDGKLFNKDTLKYYECAIALEKSGILDYLKNLNDPVVCEIGAGWGGFTYYLSKLVDNLKFIIVDLPETLMFSYIYLSDLFPGKNVRLFNYETSSLNDCDFLLIPNTEFNNYKESFDATINICSFQEMSSGQVKSYIEKVYNQKSNYIYSLNRNLNKNNNLLTDSVSNTISSFYKINELNLLNIPYTDVDVRNNNESKKIKLKNLVKKILMKTQEPQNHSYQHFFGKIN